jgi:hypothetical protein
MSDGNPTAPGSPPTGAPPPSPAGQPPAAPPPGSPPPPPPAPGQPSDPGFAERLNKLNEWAQKWGAREKADGRASVEREIAEKLGMSLDDAATLIQKGREAEQANMTEAEKKLAEAAERETKANTRYQEGTQLLRDMMCQDALMAQGMTREQARQAVPLMNIQGQVTLDSIVAAAEAVRLGFPQLFAAPAGGGNGQPGPVDSATRGGPPSNPSPGSTARDRALARLRSEQGGRLRSDPIQAPPEMDYRRSS